MPNQNQGMGISQLPGNTGQQGQQGGQVGMPPPYLSNDYATRQALTEQTKQKMSKQIDDDMERRGSMLTPGDSSAVFANYRFGKDQQPTFKTFTDNLTFKQSMDFIKSNPTASAGIRKAFDTSPIENTVNNTIKRPGEEGYFPNSGNRELPQQRSYAPGYMETEDGRIVPEIIYADSFDTEPKSTFKSGPSQNNEQVASINMARAKSGQPPLPYSDHGYDYEVAEQNKGKPASSGAGVSVGGHKRGPVSGGEYYTATDDEANNAYRSFANNYKSDNNYVVVNDNNGNPVIQQVAGGSITTPSAEDVGIAQAKAGDQRIEPKRGSLNIVSGNEYLELLAESEGEHKNDKGEWVVAVEKDASGNELTWPDGSPKLVYGRGHLIPQEESKNFKVGQVIPESLVEQSWLEDTKGARSSAVKHMEALGIQDPVLIDAFTEVSYQLGDGWPQKFPRAYELLKNGKYNEAAIEFGLGEDGKSDSEWKTQTPKRYEKLVKALNKASEKPLPGSLTPAMTKENALRTIYLGGEQEGQKIVDTKQQITDTQEAARTHQQGINDKLNENGIPTPPVPPIPEEPLPPKTEEQIQTEVEDTVAAIDPKAGQQIADQKADEASKPGVGGAVEQYAITQSMMRNPQFWNQSTFGLVKDTQMKKATLMGLFVGGAALLSGKSLGDALGLGLAGAIGQYNNNPDKINSMKLLNELGKYVQPEDRQKLHEAVAAADPVMVNNILAKGQQIEEQKARNDEIYKASLSKSGSPYSGTELIKLRAEASTNQDQAISAMKNIQDIAFLMGIPEDDKSGPINAVYKAMSDGTIGKMVLSERQKQVYATMEALFNNMTIAQKQNFTGTTSDKDIVLYKAFADVFLNRSPAYRDSKYMELVQQNEGSLVKVGIQLNPEAKNRQTGKIDFRNRYINSSDGLWGGEYGLPPMEQPVFRLSYVSNEDYTKDAVE